MDRIKDQFLQQLWEKAERLYETEMESLKQQEDEQKDKIADRINVQMKVLRDMYEQSEENPPRYLVISYLQSSLLDGYPWYRLYLYDEDFFCSDREFGVWLEAPELAGPLSRIMDMVKGEFYKQSRAEEYHIDRFLMTYAEKLHQWMAEHIFEIMRKHLLTEDWEEFYNRNKMSIYIGDYRNQVSRVFGWGLE